VKGHEESEKKKRVAKRLWMGGRVNSLSLSKPRTYVLGELPARREEKSPKKEEKGKHQRETPPIFKIRRGGSRTGAY